MMAVQIDSVVVLNDFCNAQGGASRVAIDEAIALRRLGVQVYFLGAVGPVCAELHDADVKVVCLDQPELANAVRHPVSALRAMWNQVAYQMTRTVLAPLDPRRTIVHLHGYTKALSTAPAFGVSLLARCCLFYPQSIEERFNDIHDENALGPNRRHARNGSFSCAGTCPERSSVCRVRFPTSGLGFRLDRLHRNCFRQ